MKTTNNNTRVFLASMAKLRKDYKKTLINNPKLMRVMPTYDSIERKLHERRVGMPGMVHVKDENNDN